MPYERALARSLTTENDDIKMKIEVEHTHTQKLIKRHKRCNYFVLRWFQVVANANTDYVCPVDDKRI